MKLNALNFGLSFGILWAVCLFIWTLVSSFTGYSADVLALITQIYPGYQVSVTGAFIGLVYGFFDGLIGGAIFGWLYNMLTKK